MELGSHPAGTTIYLPPDVQTYSIIGQRYELRVKTEGISDESKTASTLTRELPLGFRGLKIHYLQIENDEIDMVIEGSPFLWAALLAFIPQILAAVGVIVSIIAVYVFITSIPKWVYGAVAIGFILIFLGPKITKLIFGI